jgi:plastocyanin
MQHCISKLIFGGVLCLGLTRAGDIEGNVVIHRTLTKRKVTVAAGQYDRGASVHLGSAETEDRLAFERTHVVIYLEGQHASPPVTASIEQKERQFSPDVLVIPSGSSISFPNMDPIFHNVFSLSKPKTFDLGNYPKGQTRLVTFPKPGIVFVNCRLHPNMTATIVVTPNQWNTIAGSSGDFALHDVPPGKYTIVAWHKAAGFFREPVEVRANAGRDGSARGDSAKVEFVIPLAEDGTAIPHESSTNSPSTNNPSTNNPSTNSPSMNSPATHDGASHEVMSKR